MDEALHRTFLAEVRKRLGIAGDATVPRRDRVETAHGLKGAAGLVGAEPMRALAAELEQALRSGDDARAAALHARLVTEAEAIASQAVAPFAGLPAGEDDGTPATPLSEWTAEEAEMLRVLFFEEADEHLRRIAEAQAALSRDPGAREALDELFRRVHTLKGSAGSIGFDGVSRAAHEAEELCAEIRAGHLRATPGILDRIDDALASLRALLAGARSTASLPARGTAPDAQPAGTPAAPTAASGAGADRDAGPATSDGGERRAPFDRRRSDDRRAPGGPERSIRVDSARLDALLDGVGELVILRARLERRIREVEGVLGDLGLSRDTLQGAAAGIRRGFSAPQPGDSWAERAARLSELETEFTDAIAHLDRAKEGLVEDAELLRRTGTALEDDLRQARLVPLEWLFHRVAGELKALARREGRPVELITAGGETELDKGVVEQITDPFLHLVRNAIAHGIEPPAARAAAGKPATGRIELRASQSGELVTLEMADDGGGVDREAIRRRLAAAGRLRPDEEVGDDALLAVLFEPGFSTRQEADGLAGRGVGLDVVRDAVTRLGGTISVESTPGAGTRFRVRLPLTTAIAQALLFKVGGQVYALPSAHVAEALPLDADEVEGDEVEVAGERLRLLHLHAVLGAEPPPGRRFPALRVQVGDRRFLATCDKIVGPRVIVVRGLGPLLAGLPLFAGVTVSGSGKAQLVLDPGALDALAFAPARERRPPRLERPAHVRRVLLVDDSRLAREAESRVLAGAGYQAVTAEDGWEAWELLGERRFDAVVTDLEMPRVDGFELISRIRAEPTLRGLPVVVLSSRTSDAVRARAAAAGATAFVAKGPLKRALVEALAAALGPPK